MAVSQLLNYCGVVLAVTLTAVLVSLGIRLIRWLWRRRWNRRY